MKILVNTAITTEHHQQIQSVSDQVRIVQTQDHQKILQEVVDTDIVFGSLENLEIIGENTNKGAFISPILFLNDDPFNKTDCHNIEVFGPESTILPNKDINEAIELIKKSKYKISDISSKVYTRNPS